MNILNRRAVSLVSGCHIAFGLWCAYEKGIASGLLAASANLYKEGCNFSRAQLFYLT